MLEKKAIGALTVETGCFSQSEHLNLIESSDCLYDTNYTYVFLTATLIE